MHNMTDTKFKSWRLFSTIKICNFSSIWCTKLKKMAKIGDFTFSAKMTKSGTKLLGDKKWKVSDFGLNHLFSRIGPFWVIWSKKKFGSFKNYKNRTSPNKRKKLLNDFSRTWNFHGWFLTLYSTISEGFRKIWM